MSHRRSLRKSAVREAAPSLSFVVVTTREQSRQKISADQRGRNSRASQIQTSARVSFGRSKKYPDRSWALVPLKFEQRSGEVLVVFQKQTPVMRVVVGREVQRPMTHACRPSGIEPEPLGLQPSAQPCTPERQIISIIRMSESAALPIRGFAILMQRADRKQKGRRGFPGRPCEVHVGTWLPSRASRGAIATRKPSDKERRAEHTSAAFLYWSSWWGDGSARKSPCWCLRITAALRSVKQFSDGDFAIPTLSTR